MTNHLVIYSKPNCVQCKMTKMLIQKLNYPYSDNYHGDLHLNNVIDINSNDSKKREWSEHKIQSLIRKTGLHKMPIVKVRDNDTGAILDTFGGFQPDRIKKWYKANGGE